MLITPPSKKKNFVSGWSYQVDLCRHHRYPGNVNLPPLPKKEFCVRLDLSGELMSLAVHFVLETLNTFCTRNIKQCLNSMSDIFVIYL